MHNILELKYFVVAPHCRYGSDVRLVEDVKLQNITGDNITISQFLPEDPLIKQELVDDIICDNQSYQLVNSHIDDIKCIEVKDEFTLVDSAQNYQFASVKNSLKSNNEGGDDKKSYKNGSSRSNIVLGYIDNADGSNRKAVRLKVHKVNQPNKKRKFFEPKTFSNKSQCVKCPECNIYFQTNEHLKAHMETHSGGQRNTCTFCRKYFTNKSSLQEHMKMHFIKSPLQCTVCHEKFVSKSLLRSHKLCKHGIKTNNLPQKFSSSSRMKGTVNGSRNKISVVGRCSIDSLSDKSNFEGCGQTVLSNGSNSKTNSTGVETSGSKTFKCSLCKIELSSRSELKQHSLTHWQKPYKCNECGATFTQNGSLQVHIRRHKGEKPFTCELCGNSYTRAFSLKVHMKTHTGEKPHNCEFCSSSFITSSHLNVHRRIHTGERPFSCNECSATFITTSHLNVHKRIHMISTPTPVKCTLCNVSFRDNAQLRLHRKSNHPLAHKNKKCKLNDVGKAEPIVCK